MFCIEANCATVCLQGTSAIRFFRALDPLHTPPQRTAFMRIVRLLDKAVFRELRRIVSDNFLLYGSNFASTSSDFFTNTERRETFGCLVANMIAPRYGLGVSFFCSILIFEHMCGLFWILKPMYHKKLKTVLLLLFIGWTESIYQ